MLGFGVRPRSCSSVSWSLKALSAFMMFSFCAYQAEARSVYLNGTDISSAKNQKLRNVTVQIDAQGNVYIEAAHYQVHDESAYLPLSSYMQNIPQPQNTAPLSLPGHNGKPVHLEKNAQLNLEKSGSKLPPAVSNDMPEAPAAEAPPTTSEVQDGVAKPNDL
jgi:hypothetical protein